MMDSPSGYGANHIDFFWTLLLNDGEILLTNTYMKKFIIVNITKRETISAFIINTDS